MSVAQQIELTKTVTPATPCPDEDNVTDVRFRSLVGEEGWARLPEAVRRRFSKRWKPGDMVVYQGQVVATELSRLGRWLAFLARAIGAHGMDYPGLGGGRQGCVAGAHRAVPARGR